MTKLLTAISIMQLNERSEVSLSDPVAKYIPSFASTRVASEPSQSISEPLKTEGLFREITIKDLLTHTSGMTYSGMTFTGVKTISDILYENAGFLNWSETLDSFVNTAAKLHLAFQPGKDFEYSLSFDVLGRIIEIVTDLASR